METPSYEECRICGSSTDLCEIKVQLQDQIKDFISFKEFVEYFTRVELDKDESLPQGICSNCCSTLLSFCLFAVNVENQQNKFKNRLPKDSASVKSEGSSKSQSAEEEKKTVVGPVRLMRKRENSAIYKQAIQDLQRDPDKKERIETKISVHLTQVAELFQDELAADEVKYNRIQVKEALLHKDGEVPRDWLVRYADFKTWQDFGYTCFHCKIKVKSLRALIEHFDDFKLSILKRSIKCSFCTKTFSDSPTYLISYLNHMDGHFSHLKFTCTQCGKVYVNVVKLCNHLMKEHPDCTLKIFPCYDCGLVCSSFPKLKTHKNSHTV